MTRLVRIVSAAALALLASGCQPPNDSTYAQGPAFTLDAQTPVAAFEITLCLTGANPDMRKTSR